MKITNKFYLVLSIVSLSSCSVTFFGSSSSNSLSSGESSANSSESSLDSSIQGSSETSSLESSESSLSSETSSSSSSSSSSGGLPGYTLAWSDEFDGDSLDDEYWTPMIGNGSTYGVYEWGNNEKENYQADNVSVQDGNLVITAKAENTTIGSTTYNYTSARIRSKGKISTTYGRIEAKISLPAITGTWPAFWMLPEVGDWPKYGEIDIMENGGSSTVTSSALHYQNTSGHTYVTDTHAFSQRIENPTTTKEYHTYAVEWDEEGLTFFVDDDTVLDVPKRTYHPDGSTVYTSDDDAPFNAPFHILFNMAIGGNYVSGALPPAGFTSCEMKVDYVRIYDAN